MGIGVVGVGNGLPPVGIGSFNLFAGEPPASGGQLHVLVVCLELPLCYIYIAVICLIRHKWIWLMKSIVWHGSSYEDTKAFPPEARRDAGFQLDKVQRGMEPDDWKPLATARYKALVR